ncbi:putative sulfate exporter family transporter [Robbsia sp. Bb-Pol-6]|uniref:Sulfate exporter family transporter n=1 Tax=Robbsia betulipollinis TaxID=2981849 RepID=A0ABT3ZK77_9BURK|nr:putative sulfate exporter family transporter [Robbsia betulipollinis]
MALLPGLGLSIAVTLTALAAEALQRHLLGRAWLESLVLAILIGTVLRSTVSPGARYTPGIDFSAKVLLEVAVMLLGAAISARALLAEGAPLLLAIVAVVALAIVASFWIGRAIGLSRSLALLVACGNSICGNSAIAAVAPVIDAQGEDVAASIAFTAVLGVIVVLLLPRLAAATGMSHTQFGIFAGLTVYAVPQVLAATAPVSLASVQMGTLVKLVRVLMLGPVLLAVSFLYNRGSARARGRVDAGPKDDNAVSRNPAPARRPGVTQLLPWFIVGFLGLAVLRSLGAIPALVGAPVHAMSNMLTVVAMAGLGLGVDVRSVASAGGRVILAAILSLVILGLLSAGAIHWLGVA